MVSDRYSYTAEATSASVSQEAASSRALRTHLESSEKRLIWEGRRKGWNSSERVTSRVSFQMQMYWLPAAFSMTRKV